MQDSAEATDLENFLPNATSRMDRQHGQIVATGHAIQDLIAQVSELSSQLQQRRLPTAPPVAPPDQHQPEPRLPTPERYGGFHPRTNGKTERANQDLKRALRCLVTQSPTSWCQQLPWVKYTHNSLPVSSTGLSPIECSLGYQPPLFPSMESEVAVPSAHAFVQRCHRTWTRARETPLQVRANTKAKADRHWSKPSIHVTTCQG
ncbi:hypothetical protein QQF64_009597 [Cirrhinus molitorella]|uniref:Integrase catalytic domain-containing protein n=1 Tax=Cirrhinus molitorella TaxID=172907 RepID=A0ABR3M2H2_9TELE